MWHRHLNHSDWTLAAVDDVIARGRMDDWKQLRDVAAQQAEVRDRILQVCAAHFADPYAQRYHFWTSMSASNLPEWERLLAAAAHLQEI